tara:strand:+ start:18052 stop:19572 length:1521 start_codon:yes stop_codon:yes gene_type:complete
MTRKIAFVTTLLFWASQVLAQIGFATMGDSVLVRINSNGSLGVNLSNLSPSSSLANQTNNHFIKQAGLYIVARDVSGQFHSAIQYMQGIDSFDFWPGPVDTLTGQTGNIEDWDNVWSISKEEVDYHKNNWTKDGYKPIISIANWPANGSNGYAQYLAPFMDYNSDGVYNPELGDYPAIRGEKSAYCIFNDLAEEHAASLGVELGLEVQLMVYQLANSKTIYLEYYLINRSILDFDNTWVGFFIDGQCGNPNDNFAGTFQTYPQSVFVYNGDELDEGYFEENLPFVSATFLNENLTRSIAFDNTTNINGAPVSMAEFIETGQGNWKNGQPLQQGGEGVITTNTTEYIFNQSTSSSNPWVEEVPINTLGKRTIVGITEHTNFTAKSFIKLDIALDFGFYKSEDRRIETIAAVCDQSLNNYRNVTSAKKVASENTFSVYPNPITSSQFTLDSRHTYDLEIIDFQGITTYSENNIKKGKKVYNIHLDAGIYVLKLTTEKGVQTIKLCVSY